MILDLFRGFTGEMSSELESALENPETDVLFDSFLLERKERPDLLAIINTEQTFKDYLSLPVECRAEVESLRLKDPEYLAGDYERSSPIGLRTKRKSLSDFAFNFFKKLHVENAVQRIVDKFIEYQPKSKKGPVPLVMWFQRYDPLTGKSLTGSRNSTTIKTPLGNKFYQSYFKSSAKREMIVFDDWVRKQLTQDLLKRLEHTEYCQRADYGVVDVVNAFIKFQPVNRKGPVPLTSWFEYYNIVTGARSKYRGADCQGRKFYVAFLSDRTLSKRVGFEEHILGQIPVDLREQLSTTEYFKRDNLGIEYIVKAFIKFSPATYKGLVGLKSWFNSYNPATGECVTRGAGRSKRRASTLGNRYYAKHYTKFSKDITFDDWILSQLQDDELKAELQSTPYWKEKYG